MAGTRRTRWAAHAGSVILRAEDRGSTQTRNSMVGGADYCRRGTDDAVVPRH